MSMAAIYSHTRCLRQMNRVMHGPRPSFQLTRIAPATPRPVGSGGQTARRAFTNDVARSPLASGSVGAAAGIAAAATAASTARGVALCHSDAKKKKKKWKEEALPERTQAELVGRVDAWLAAAPPGGKAPPLHFETGLSAGERKFVHALCETRRSEVSSKSEGSGGARHVVVYHTPIEAGMVGGVSAARRGELAARVEAFFEKVKDVGRESSSQAALHFEPSLTTAEREFVHHVAAQYGLGSKSEGEVYHGADWHIVVRRY